MSLYDQIPVYKEAYDLLLQICEFSSNLSKDMKEPFGVRLKNLMLDELLLIVKANEVQDKRAYLESALELMPQIQFIIRVLKDTKQISVRQFALLSEHTVSISKQLAGWKKHYEN